MAGYIIYHPRRQCSVFNDVVTYHDSTIGNQDPYIWNDRFLHTYCHITQMKPEVGHRNFWVSGDTFPNFNNLYCDLVFHVRDKLYWQDANHIERNDPIIDSDESFNDHYRWAEQHPFKRRRRFTLKADPANSFQPLGDQQHLVDVVPVLLGLGFELDQLRNSVRATKGSKPLYVDDNVASHLFDFLSSRDFVQRTGDQLRALRQDHPCLASL